MSHQNHQMEFSNLQESLMLQCKLPIPGTMLTAPQVFLGVFCLLCREVLHKVPKKMNTNLLKQIKSIKTIHQ